MTERKRDVVALCNVCFGECGYQEELTPGWRGPYQCRRCGKICQKQGTDFRVVWYPPPVANEYERSPICVTCGYAREIDGSERHAPLCAIVRGLIQRVERLEET